ncbi:hypothetical protein BJX70DRAFT_158815 [Aspergillus crustosus]
MSFPHRPGQQQPPSSLPPRPPQPTDTNTGGYGGNAPRPGFSATAFQPRSVASQQPYRTSSPVVSAPPSTQSGYSTPATAGYGSYYSQPQPSYQSGPSYYDSSQQYNNAPYGQAVPHIQNPFAPTGADGRGNGQLSGLDPETEAQIAQWQSAYANNDTSSLNRGTIRRDGATGTPSVSTTVYTSSGSTPAATAPAPTTGQTDPQKTVARSGGGQNWSDSTLLEWDPAHFRLFVGNLAGEVTDDSLLKAFAKYDSVEKARVIRDKRTQKSKGYGFVSFSDGDDYFKAAREMQGKYIGSHPILLRRATTEIRQVSNSKNKKHGGKGGGGGGNQGSKVKHDGIKKPGKTKGGLRILG